MRKTMCKIMQKAFSKRGVHSKARLAPKKIYAELTKFFPVSTVDVVLFNNSMFILTRRNIKPYKGMWHLPGGIIRKREKIENAAKRTVKNELNVEIKLEKFLGVYENPIKTRHDISHCFVAAMGRGKIQTDFQSTGAKFFKKVPVNTVPYQKIIIKDALRYMHGTSKHYKFCQK